MKMRSVTPTRIAKIGYIIMSFIFCAVGILFIVLPELSLMVVWRILGIAMVAFGCVKLVGYLSKDLYRLAFQYDLEFGILLIVLGIIVLIKPMDMMNLISIAMGVAILAEGLFKIRISLDSKRFGIKSWWTILALALITGVIGLLLMLRPYSGAAVLMTVMGIALLCEGALNICVAVSTVKIIKNQYPDVIDVDYYESESEEK